MSFSHTQISLVDSQLLALQERFGWEAENAAKYLSAKEAKNGLIIVSGDAKTSPPEFRRRGIVMYHDKILSEGSLIPIEIRATSVSKIVENGVDILSVVNAEGERVDFPEPKIHPFLAGVFLSVIYDPEVSSEIIVSTYNNANISGTQARWDVTSSVTFMDMLRETGFPLDEVVDLANHEAFSVKLHVFHKELSYVTRQNATCYAVVVDCDNATLELGLRARFGLQSEIGAEVKKPCIFSMPEFTVDEAVDFFYRGWWNFDSSSSPQLGTGEVIMIDIGGAIYKVISESWSFREEIRGPGANLWNAFVTGISRVCAPGFFEKLRVPSCSEDELREMLPLVFLDPDGSFSPTENIETKLHRYHTAFVFSVAPPFQEQAIKFLGEYQRIRIALRNILFDVEKKFHNESSGKIRDEKVHLLEMIERRAVAERHQNLRQQDQHKDMAQKEQNACQRCADIIITAVEAAVQSKSKVRRSFNMGHEINRNIGSLLGSERGLSFYNIMRYFGLHHI